MEIPWIPYEFDKSRAEVSALHLKSFLFPGSQRDGEIEVVVLTEGTTNGLFKVTHRPSHSRPVAPEAVNETTALVKIYGDGTEITIDRDKELKFHKILSDHGLAAPLLVRFQNGHAYQYVAGTVCSVRDMAKERIWRGVARELARWHALLPRPDLPEDQGAHSILQYEPTIWSTAKKWLATLPDDTDGDKALKDSLLEEFEFLKHKLLPNSGQQHSLVFGHGDLLCGNIILRESADEAQLGNAASVQFIDYEHSTYCPRALELANHFAEWAGFECDYNLLPAVSTRRGFLREYLMTYRSIANQSSHVGESETFNEELDRLMEEVDMYRGFPGFYWGVCALIQARTASGSIDFDYSGYFERRISEYWEWRAEEDGSRVRTGQGMPFREARWAAEHN